MCRRLNLLWGVIPCLIEPAEFEQPPQAARRLAVDLGLAASGDVILLLAGSVPTWPHSRSWGYGPSGVLGLLLVVLLVMMLFTPWFPTPWYHGPVVP